MPVLLLQMPSSSLMAGPLGTRMAPSAGMMMPGSNPYGPSGPPPPSLSGTSFSAPSGGMSGPPGGRIPHSMYPTSGSVGPGASSGGGGSGPGMPSGGGGVGGGASHQSSHPPLPGGPPTSKLSSVFNTTQLQQLSAQLKAYKLLARNVSLPEALMSIVHGHKPTVAMLAAVGKQQQHPQSSHPSSSSLGVPPPGDVQRGPGGSGGGAAAAASEGGSGGNISLYPLSPNVSQGALSSSMAQSQAPIRSTSSLSQSLTSSSMSAASGPAPNVTISSSGELPLSVKQAMSAAQSRSSSTPPMTSGQQSSTPPMTSISPAPASSHGPTPPTQVGTTSTAASGQSVPMGQSQQHPQSQQQQQQQQTAGNQQQQPQQQMKPQLKSMKLAPPGKPQGIDPTVIIKERENRFVCYLASSMFSPAYKYLRDIDPVCL